MRITNNFERVIGEGGFGTVYHGYLDDTQVAVKMLSPSSVQGYKQFKAEVYMEVSSIQSYNYSREIFMRFKIFPFDYRLNFL